MKSLQRLFYILILILFNSCGNNNDDQVLEASGTIESKEITISSKVAGEVKKLLVDEGTQVKQNDTLIIIDNEAYLIQLKQAEASRLISESQLELLKNGARKEDIVQAEELLKQSKSNYLQAENDKKRMEELFVAKSISKRQLEEISTKYEVALAQYNSAKENLMKIKNFARPEELKQAEARYKQSLANEELVRKNIRDCYIISPKDGFVVKSFVEEGENVNLLTSLVKLADLSTVELSIYMSEKQLGKIKLGQKAEIFVDAFPGKAFEGIVGFISPEAEFTPKNIQTKDERTKLVFEVEIKISNSKHELKTGMPADAKIVITEN